MPAIVKASSEAQPRKRRRLSEPDSEEATLKSASAKRKSNRSASKGQVQRPVKSTGAVEKAKVSGGSPETIKSSKRNEKDVVGEGNGNDEPLPPVKGLDSSDPSIRRKTFNTIMKHLQSRSPANTLTETECLQLWRGFYVNLYMHDSKNALSVQRLITELAGTFSIVAAKDDELTETAMWLSPWHTAFWTTLVREWRGIDQWRINKYLSLVRYVTRELFVIIFSRALAADATSEAVKQTLDVQISVLKTVGPFNPSDRKIADGLRLHLCDVWVDELVVARDRVMADEGVESSSEELSAPGILDTLKDPLLGLANGSSQVQKNVRDKAKEALQEFEDRITDAAADAATDE